MILLSEWNIGIFVVIIALLLIPVLLIFFVSLWILKTIPAFESFIQRSKQEKPYLYVLSLFTIFIISVLLTILILYLQYADSGKGVLEYF
ncbi:MAG TPA: hypothetical protein VD794_09105 [Flavisolibacter sp.]|nr:hypothetical protein [Flavisolibacter sp.]